MIKKLVFFIILLFIECSYLFSIIIEDKINAKSRLIEVNRLIKEKRYEDAIQILQLINENLNSTEFFSFVNYYFSVIKFEQGDYYKALYFIENAINDSKFYLVSKENRIKMKLHYAMVCYKLDFIDIALCIFKEIKDYSIVYKDEINLYISEIYFVKKNDAKNATIYFRNINLNNLSPLNKDLYYYLENFLLWYNIDTSKINYKDPNVNCILVDKDILYIGLWQGGLIAYNYILETWENINLSSYCSEEIRSLYTDGRKIYIGTTKGVAILDKRNYSITSEESLKDVSITAIASDQNFVYYGTVGKGLLAKDINNNEFYQIIDKENISVLSYYDATLYIGTYNGNVYEYENGIIKYLKELSFLRRSITSFLRDANNLWITTHGEGIICYKINNKKVKKYSINSGDLPDNFILSSEIKKDKIYFSTLGNGIIFFDKNVNKWYKFKISDMYLINEIQCITFSEDYMFIGTLGAGVLQKLLINED